MDCADQLERYREEINRLDEHITDALGKRLRICMEVGHLKKAHGIAMMQPARVEAVKARCAQMGAAHGLRPEFMTELYDRIIAEACLLETRIIEAEA